MARYRILPSAAHNYGASFISVMNIGGGDYVMCHLLRAATAGGVQSFEVDLLSGHVSQARLPDEVRESIGHYVRGFGAHIQRSGAALDMISRAVMRIVIARGHVIGIPDPEGVQRAQVHCEVELTDDRGKVHVGRTHQAWVCHATRRFY